MIKIKNLNLKIIIVSLIIWAIVSGLATLSAGLYWLSENRPANWAHLFWYKYSYGIIWSLLSPLLLQIVMKLSFDQFSRMQLFLWHLAGAIILAPIHRFLSASLNHSIQTYFNLFNRPYGWWEYVGNNFFGNAMQGITTYWIIVMVLYAYFLYWRNIQNRLEKTRLTADLSKAKLKNLESQLHPHFLFNSMQSISALMHKDVEKADTAMSELSDLLRMSFKKGDEAKIAFADELAFCKKYIALQQLRFQDNLQIHLNCPNDIMGALVPNMILQPFLENSIKHGFESLGERGVIQVDITRNDDQLEIKIADNGKVTLKNLQFGTGFQNTTSRLKYLYKERAAFNYEIVQGGGFEVSIKLPFEKN